MKPEDIIGKKFGRLTVLKKVASNKYGRSVMACRCDCGKYVNVSMNSIMTGNTKSCGCLNKESKKERGKALTFRSIRNKYISKIVNSDIMWKDVVDKLGYDKVDKNELIVFKQLLIDSASEMALEHMKERNLPIAEL